MQINTDQSYELIFLFWWVWGFFFNNMHIYLLSQCDLSVYSGSEWRQKCDSASLASPFPRVLLQRSRMKGLCSVLLWSFCWIPVPMTVTLKPQMQQDQTEPPTPFKLELFSHHTGTILALLAEAGSKAVLNPVFCHHLHQPSPPTRWQTQRGAHVSAQLRCGLGGQTSLPRLWRQSLSSQDTSPDISDGIWV